MPGKNKNKMILEENYEHSKLLDETNIIDRFINKEFSVLEKLKSNSKSKSTIKNFIPNPNTNKSQKKSRKGSNVVNTVSLIKKSSLSSEKIYEKEKFKGTNIGTNVSSKTDIKKQKNRGREREGKKEDMIEKVENKTIIKKGLIDEAKEKVVKNKNIKSSTNVNLTLKENILKDSINIVPIIKQSNVNMLKNTTKKKSTKLEENKLISFSTINDTKLLNSKRKLRKNEKSSNTLLLTEIESKIEEFIKNETFPLTINDMSSLTNLINTYSSLKQMDKLSFEFIILFFERFCKLKTRKAYAEVIADDDKKIKSCSTTNMIIDREQSDKTLNNYLKSKRHKLNRDEIAYTITSSGGGKTTYLYHTRKRLSDENNEFNSFISVICSFNSNTEYSSTIEKNYPGCSLNCRIFLDAMYNEYEFLKVFKVWVKVFSEVQTNNLLLGIMNYFRKNRVLLMIDELIKLCDDQEIIYKNEHILLDKIKSELLSFKSIFYVLVTSLEGSKTINIFKECSEVSNRPVSLIQLPPLNTDDNKLLNPDFLLNIKNKINFPKLISLSAGHPGTISYIYAKCKENIVDDLLLDVLKYSCYNGLFDDSLTKKYGGKNNLFLCLLKYSFSRDSLTIYREKYSEDETIIKNLFEQSLLLGTLDNHKKIIPKISIAYLLILSESVFEDLDLKNDIAFYNLVCCFKNFFSYFANYGIISKEFENFISNFLLLKVRFEIYCLPKEDKNICFISDSKNDNPILFCKNLYGKDKVLINVSKIDNFDICPLYFNNNKCYTEEKKDLHEGNCNYTPNTIGFDSCFLLNSIIIFEQKRNIDNKFFINKKECLDKLILIRKNYYNTTINKYKFENLEYKEDKLIFCIITNNKNIDMEENLKKTADLNEEDYEYKKKLKEIENFFYIFDIEDLMYSVGHSFQSIIKYLHGNKEIESK